MPLNSETIAKITRGDLVLIPKEAVEGRSARLAQAVEIGMANLTIDGAHHKQFAIEAMLALLCGCADVPELRARYKNKALAWEDGIPA